MDPEAPAFPQSVAVNPSDDLLSSSNLQGGEGLTIRAEFAKAAMQGLLAHFGFDLPRDEIAQRALGFADEQIAELNKTR